MYRNGRNRNGRDGLQRRHLVHGSETVQYMKGQLVHDLPAVLLSLLHSGAKERKRRLDNYGTRAREGGVRCRGEQPQDRCVDEAVASFYRQQAVDVPIPHAGGTGPRRGPDVNAHANCVRIHAWARGTQSSEAAVNYGLHAMSSKQALARNVADDEEKTEKSRGTRRGSRPTTT